MLSLGYFPRAEELIPWQRSQEVGQVHALNSSPNTLGKEIRWSRKGSHSCNWCGSGRGRRREMAEGNVQSIISEASEPPENSDSLWSQKIHSS